MSHDKSPTYNFACSVDDMLFNISTVVRNEEYLDDTSKQIHLRESLGYNQVIKYAHLPTIVNKQTGEKISKEDNFFYVNSLIEQGYLPAAISNYLILLAYDTPIEIFTLEEAMEWFDISKVSKKPVKFDIEKLKFLNNEHLKMIDELRFSKILGYADEDIGKLGKLYLQQCDTIKQIKEKIDAIFAPKIAPKDLKEEFETLKQCLQNAPYIDEFDNLQKYITKEISIEGEKLLLLLRYTLTGVNDSSNLSEVYPLIKNYLGEIVK
jgi:glutamyl-tRNA synthetase